MTNNNTSIDDFKETEFRKPKKAIGWYRLGTNKSNCVIALASYSFSV
jgi:hypothetical protein